jgi:hypothetical protein
MAWWMAAPLVASAAGSLGNILGANKQADAMTAQAAEQARRMRLAHDATLGETRARIAASGIESDSVSSQTYLTEMVNEFRREEDWIRKSVAADAGAMKGASIFGALTGIGSSILSYGQMSGWGK